MIERSSDARGLSEHSKSSVCGADTRPAPVSFAHRPVKWMPTTVCSLLTPRLENSAPSICSRNRLRRGLTVGAVDRRCEGTTDNILQFQPSPRVLCIIQIHYCCVQQRGHFRDEKQPVLIVLFASQSISSAAIPYLCRTDKKKHAVSTSPDAPSACSYLWRALETPTAVPLLETKGKIWNNNFERGSRRGRIRVGPTVCSQ